MLRHLPANHDGLGAGAAIASTVDEALSFLPEIQTELSYGVTLDDDGHAVFEFEDKANGIFADLTFMGDGVVECYLRRPGVPSTSTEGAVRSEGVRTFLRDAGVIG